MIYNNLNGLISRALLAGISPEMREALSLITDEMIGRADYRLIVRAIKELDNFNSQVDLLSVGDYLGDKIEFGFLGMITKDAAPTKTPLRTALQVVSLHNDKIAAAEMRKAIEQLTSGRPFDRNELSGVLSDLSEKVAPTVESKPKSFYDYAQGYPDVLEQRQENKNSYGVSLGIDLTVKRTAFIVIGGQPGMGKTALMSYINYFIASKGRKTLVFSLEMGGDELFERQVSAMASVSTDKLRGVGENGLSNEDWTNVSNSVRTMMDLGVYIDDNPKLSMPIFKKKCRDFVDNNPDTDLITVDYLTLMDLPSADRRDLSVGEVTRQCKLLSKELKVPIVMLSQLNREADKAAREPRNSDLRDSGSIEQDADVIIFPYREEVHNPNSPNKGLAKIIKSKVRDGETGVCVMGWRNGAFYEFDGQWRETEPEQKQTRPKF